MFKSDKGFAALLFVLIIVFLSIGVVGGSYYLSKLKGRKVPVTTYTHQTVPLPTYQTSQSSPSATVMSSTDWLVYSGSFYNLNYPNGWVVDDKDKADVTVKPPAPKLPCNSPTPCIGDGPGDGFIEVTINGNSKGLSLDQYVHSDAESLYPGEPLTTTKLTDELVQQAISSGIPKNQVEGNHAQVYYPCNEDDLYFLLNNQIITLKLYCLPGDTSKNVVSGFKLKN